MFNGSKLNYILLILNCLTFFLLLCGVFLVLNIVLFQILMAGIRGKIRFGFIAISTLLFLAGVISYLEITRLDTLTNNVVNIGAKSVMLSNEMMDILSHQDSLVISFVRKRDTARFITESNLTVSKLEKTRKSVETFFAESKDIEEMSVKLNDFTDVLVMHKGDSLMNEEWYFTTYKGAYNGFVTTLKQFMRSTQESVVAETKLMKNNAYRAITQGIVTHAAAILIIIIFFALIDIYFIRPVTTMTKAVKNYLKRGTPLDLKVTGRDEVYMLKEYIEQLVIKVNQKGNNRGC